MQTVWQLQGEALAFAHGPRRPTDCSNTCVVSDAESIMQQNLREHAGAAQQPHPVLGMRAPLLLPVPLEPAAGGRAPLHERSADHPPAAVPAAY